MEQNARFRLFINPFNEQQRQSECLGPQGVWAPPTDVYETDDALVIKMAIPGIQTGNVRIRFAPGAIVIMGHRDFQKDADMVAYHQMEIRSGRFERRIRVHVPLDPGKTTARYEDGFLTIRVPKSPMHGQEIYTVKFVL